MTLLLDNILGEGATADLTEAGTVQGQVPTVLQVPAENGVEIALAWDNFSQNFIVSNDKAVMWRAGLCAATSESDMSFLSELSDRLITTFADYEMTTSSIYAPGDTANPLLELGYQRSADNWNIVECDIRLMAERIRNDSTN